jgi:integrating conjugative element protein (TIGR03758 family)
MVGSVARGGGSYSPGSLGPSAAPDTAFEGASGVGMGQTADAIKLMAGALVLLWLAWASKATWKRFVSGGAEVRDMTWTMMRAAGVALVAIFLLS